MQEKLEKTIVAEENDFANFLLLLQKPTLDMGFTIVYVHNTKYVLEKNY